MLRRFALPTSFLVLLTCGGCFPNGAVVDPSSYAPLCASKPWNHPKLFKKKSFTSEIPALDQEEPYSLGELIPILLFVSTRRQSFHGPKRELLLHNTDNLKRLLSHVEWIFHLHPRPPTYISINNSFTATPVTGTGTTTTPSVNPQITVDDVYYSNWFPELTVSFLVFDFGTRRATSEAARQALYNADRTHNNTILTLPQTIMNDYYTYLYQKQLLSADEADVATAKVTLNAAQTGLENGVRDISDYLQAKTKLLQAQTTWASQQQNVVNSDAQLLDDMGLPANMCVNTQELPLVLPDSDLIPPLDTLIAVALQNRPDLMAAYANV